MTTGAVLTRSIEPLVLLATAWLTPSLTGPTLPFGVRVPASHAADPVVTAQRRAYRRWVAVGGGGPALLGLALTTVTGDRRFGLAAMVVVGAACVTGYLRARSAIRAVKRREDWYRGLRQTVAVDTSLRTSPEPFPWRWAAPALLVPGLTAVAAVVRYPSMPDRLPTHFGAAGSADHYAAKSVGSAFAPVFAQAGLTVIILLLAWFTFRARADIDPARPAASALQHRRFIVRTTVAVLLLAACCDVSVLLAAWQIWRGAHTVSATALLAPVVVGLAIVIGVALRTGQNGSRIAVDDDPTDPTGRLTHEDDDRYWRAGGLVYANRQDSALFVPKRFGFGWTVNFANPRVLLLAALIAGFPVAMSLIAR